MSKKVTLELTVTPWDGLDCYSTNRIRKSQLRLSCVFKSMSTQCLVGCLDFFLAAANLKKEGDQYGD